MANVWLVRCGLVAAAVGMMWMGPGARGQAPPVLSPATAAAEHAAQAQAPQAPSTQAVSPATTFPPVDPKNFTAPSPTAETVNSFLKAIWGYDENRVWSVAAVLKTSAPGVAKVIVFVGDKSQPGKGTQTVFYITPDGKHAIADQVIDFGATPFADTRKILQDRADGPAKGSTSKELMLVEFTDLQCVHCKDGQETMNNLAREFPQARIVVENRPLMEIHPFAFRAAAEGICVRKAKGDAAYFTYAQKVYDKQDGLTTEAVEATLAAAATAAGADPKAAAVCAAGDAARSDVMASVKLATDLGIDQTPVLVVNGHLLPLGAIPYETLKKLIASQAQQDGVVVHLQPSLTSLK